MSDTDQFKQLCSLGNLLSAWTRVEESDGCAGIDGVTLERFADDLDVELQRLGNELADGTYQPLPVAQFFVPKRSGGQRRLCVLAVRDRVAQHAVIGVILPRVEAEFENISFAYRRGRSVKQALAEVERLREAGYQFVVDADIASYFDNVDHALLLERLADVVEDARIRNLIETWIAPMVYDGQQMAKSEKGLPQGSPLSPLLANLFLDTMDDRLLAAGLKLVRFADDFLVLCKSREKAEEALALVKQSLADLRLTLNEEKTRITDFAQGFTFLGATFVHSLCLATPADDEPEEDATRTAPPRLTMPEIETAVQRALAVELAEFGVPASAGSNLPPEGGTLNLPPPQLFSLRTLYIQEHGTVLRCEDERLRVSKDDQELLDLPAFKIDQIILFGNAMVTTPAMKFCMRNNIPIIVLSGRGEFFGVIESTNNQNVILQQQQFARVADEGFVLETARRIVAGKIGNCRALLQRRQRASGTRTDDRLAKAIAAIEEIKGKLSFAETIDQVRGYEGSAAARYYDGLAACIQSPFEFKGRTRRPPLDPVNALLSFGYTLLFYNIYAIARGRGLSPYVGSLHSIRQGHPALCSDLIEELRAPIVDSLVTAVLNKRVIGQGDFYYSETSGGKRGCFLTDPARRTFIAQFEQRINTVVQHPRAGINTTWRGCIDIQIGHYVQLLRGEIAEYLPIEIR
ncbi:MAG: CRISPR-associated endonuclease Cas1 [Acidobacteria bacterium]|nr:CRISPR-associated endonuclease Cas1 [Acidobacteriota bacterium]